MELFIVPVTDKNRDTAENLRVYPEQSGYIETVSECMQEADELKDWKPVCVCDGDKTVGFAMYGLISEDKYTRLWFDRFLIDRLSGTGICKARCKAYFKADNA